MTAPAKDFDDLLFTPTSPSDEAVAQVVERETTGVKLEVFQTEEGGRKLDLACGQRPRDGFEGADLYAGAQHRLDLLKFPWPWADNTFSELHCSHFVEHIPAREVEERDVYKSLIGEYGAYDYHKYIGKDMFFAFFDECYRILKPGGVMTVVCPSVKSTRAFWDPTHRRFIDQMTFFYLYREWRVSQKLDHYKVECNFAGNVNPTVDENHTLKSADRQAFEFRHYWDVVYDWVVTLKSLKEPA